MEPTNPSLTPFSSTPLDLLIRWGEAHLIHGPEEGDSGSIPENWHTQPSAWEQVKNELTTHEALVEQALRWLTGPETLHLDEADWPIVRRHLSRFDESVFLIEALERIPGAGSLPADMHQRAEAIIDMLTDHESAWLRLIPLNRHRRKALDPIPSDARYLFPWYEAWSDLPEDTFGILVDRWVDRWDDIGDLRPSFGGEAGEAISILIQELHRDPALLNRLHQDVRIFQSVKAAATEDKNPSTAPGADRMAAKGSAVTVKGLLEGFRNRFPSPAAAKCFTAAALGCLALFLMFSYQSRNDDGAMDPTSAPPRRFKVELPAGNFQKSVHPPYDPEQPPLSNPIRFSRFTLAGDVEDKDTPDPDESEPTGLPLQRYDLTQLRLAATIRSSQINRALVKTPDGRGYIVREGTPIGRNNGFVVEIQKDRIVIEESLEGEEGEAVVRWEVLRLPEGGD